MSELPAADERDDLQRQLLTAFDAEITARVAALDRGLLALEEADGVATATAAFGDLYAAAYNLQGAARVVDLDSRRAVSHATVNKEIGRLNRDGLVHNQPYRSLFLPDEGWALARRCKERHQVVLDFLLALGVSPATAEADAEGVEHHVSAETLAAFQSSIAQKT